MIVSFSTSSPLTSVAVFGASGEVRYSGETTSPGASSEACLLMLSEAGVFPPEVTLWLADVGPGSFTGTRVGVVLAKTFAWTFGVPCGGADAFDLTTPDRTVAILNRRGEWLVRVPGERAKLVRSDSAPAELGTPHAARFHSLLKKLEHVSPHALLPIPIVEPSITLPRPPVIT